MDAIKKLMQAGMTRKQIALTIGLSTPHLIGMYEAGTRFPGKHNYRQIVELAEQMGITLLARDFINEAQNDASNARCVVVVPTVVARRPSMHRAR